MPSPTAWAEPAPTTGPARTTVTAFPATNGNRQGAGSGFKTARNAFPRPPTATKQHLLSQTPARSRPLAPAGVRSHPCRDANRRRLGQSLLATRLGRRHEPFSQEIHHEHHHRFG